MTMNMNILINRSDALGDTLLTIPMAKMIKNHYPESKVYFLVKERSRELIKHNPYIDGVICWNEGQNFFQKFFSLVKKMRPLKLSHYFYVGGSHFPSMVALLMLISFRGGTLSKWKAFLCLNKGMRQKRSQVDMHEAEYNFNLLRSLGINYLKKMKGDFGPEIYLEVKEIESSEKDLREIFLEQKLIWKDEYIVIHPGMTGHSLNWPSRYYARFILELEETLPHRFSYIVSFTPSDQRYMREFKEELFRGVISADLKERICFFDGSVKGLRNFCGVVSKARLFLGPSTGTTHIAHALKVPVIGIYSPIKVQSSLRWGPYYYSSATASDSPITAHSSGAPQVQVVVPDVICGETFECAGRECPYFECMKKIEVFKIVNLAKDIIGE